MRILLLQTELLVSTWGRSICSFSLAFTRKNCIVLLSRAVFLRFSDFAHSRIRQTSIVKVQGCDLGMGFFWIEYHSSLLPHDTSISTRVLACIETVSKIMVR